MHLLPLESKEWEEAVVAALAARQMADRYAPNPLATSLLVRAEMEGMETADRVWAATTKVLLEGIAALRKDKPQVADVLKQRYFEDKMVKEVALALKLSEDQVKRHQRTGISRLVEDLRQRETTLRQQRQRTMEGGLSAPLYRVLFGIDAIREKLVADLLSPTGPMALAIVGIGGIGKTSLSDAVARQIISHFVFEQILWVRTDTMGLLGGEPEAAQLWEHILVHLTQRLCPLLSPETPPDVRYRNLRQTLKAAPYLIVIDNLETLDDIVYLEGYLHDLADPSRFLLTSRIHPPGELSLTTHVLGELPEEAALALIQYQAQFDQLEELTNANSLFARRIYEVVGGHPLALKIVVGQLHALPLVEVLADLHDARLVSVEFMYQRIYERAWNVLSEESRQLLQMMPLAPGDGVPLEQMQAFSSLGSAQLRKAIPELVNRSLLIVGGTEQIRRYSIHRLTKMFVEHKANLPE